MIYAMETNASHLPTMALSPSSTVESTASNSPPLTPFTRESSPSPSISPTPAIFSCPPLSRSFSANSSSAQSTISGSTSSHPSTATRSSSASAALRQRGYVRPQGVTFAPSAGNRDSVLSLGSIAHLQYYFARTGLLDGKGGQLAKEDKSKITKPLPRIYDNPASSERTTTILKETDGSEAESSLEEPLMLPPTVSTYSHRVQYIPPPPDSDTLRQDLKSSLREARKALQDVQDQDEETRHRRPQQSQRGEVSNEDIEVKVSSVLSQSSSWYEIQGVHILDVVTLAIRAAKMYYTSHEEPQRLYSIKSERQIRKELYGVLETLKKMASRNFAGGTREEELNIMNYWVDGVEAFLTKEESVEAQERKARDSWEWLEGSWEGRERERERLFLNSFLLDGSLPEWRPINNTERLLNPFLEWLRDGLTLVHLHNTLLRKSKRQFGDIKVFHNDTAKPYRCAENLRYWIKAAEIRWEIKLKVNVSGVVNAKIDAWPDFDAAILQWSRHVREELTKEWKEAAIRPLAVLASPEDQETRTCFSDDL